MKSTSKVIETLFIENNNALDITTLRGIQHTIYYNSKSKQIYSESALGTQQVEIKIFDMITEFLRKNKGYAPKGEGRNSKVGDKRCDSGTVCGFLAINYYGHKVGESTFDPVFVLAAIMEKAGIAENLRGSIQLNPEYMEIEISTLVIERNLHPGDIVSHFKRELVTDGSTKYLYRILHFAKHSETSEKMVVYEALYGDFGIWVRPYDMFMEEVDHIKYPDIKQKYRFEKVAM